MFAQVRKDLEKVFHRLARQKESLIEEGHIMGDHVHIMISIPPKYAVSQVVGFIKGESAIYIARTYLGRKRNSVGQNFWARGYFASTVGRDEQVIRDYIWHQEAEDRRMDQLQLMYNAGMNIEDARKLSPSAQEEKRKLAIRLWKRGELIKDVAVTVGVSAQAVSGWIKRYKAEDPVALKTKKRGPEVGNTRRLTSEQEIRLQKMITDNVPDQLKLAYALWTRKAVMELIEQETGIVMPIRTVGEYLKRWGFTPQKPAKRAYE